MLGNKEILEKSQTGQRQNLQSSLPSRNKILVLVVKTYAKADIKVFLCSPVLLEFSNSFQIFCPGLWKQIVAQHSIVDTQTSLFWYFL